MIANLGMYDMPTLRGATDALWAGIRAQLDDGPAQLTRGADLWEIWRSPDLLFAQTCGYPYRAKLRSHVHLIATPDYALPGCPPGYYNSLILARADDPRSALTAFDGARFAYNEALSQSGWAAPAQHFQARNLTLGALHQTGSHAASADAVAEGQADFCALDALTYLLLCDADPAFGSRFKIIERTASTPALPYITARTRDPAPLLGALKRAVAALDPAHRTALRLRDVLRIPETAYLSVPTPPAPNAHLPDPPEPPKNPR